MEKPMWEKSLVKRRVLHKIQWNKPQFSKLPFSATSRSQSASQSQWVPVQEPSRPVPLMPQLSNISLLLVLSTKVRFLHWSFLKLTLYNFFLFVSFGLEHPAICLKWRKGGRGWEERRSKRTFPAGKWVTAVFPWLAFHCSWWPLQAPLMSQCPGMSLY